MTALLPYAAAGVVVLVLLAIGLFMASAVQSARRRRVARRLSGPSGRQRGGGRSEWFMRVAEQGQRFDALIEDPEETTLLLAQAGWRGVRGRALFFSLQLLFVVIGLVSMAVLWVPLAAAFGTLLAVALAVILVLAAAVLPRVALRMVAKRRRETLRAEAPLFVNLIMLLFEAGLSTRQALNSLVQDGARTLPETTAELAPVLRQVEAGGDMSALLRDMSKTLGVEELESVIGILRQVERYGGEVREPLNDALETIEERRTLEVRERVNVLSGKMTVVLVTCFFPALLVFIVGPAFVSISDALANLGGGS